ncbi:hypothetical protein ACB098_03G176200 [Castanea mollissima]|uniref:Uncharacterized protein n=1 Tax=Castanea mollissima TaxID=60419 RepID=A0A8J4QMS2_9ROSI|nr:hypothetical protein CMV_020642 [Castanea mollissima]
MKFGKEFKKQMVPEWTEAYMDYNGLKRILGEVRGYKQTKHSATHNKALQKKPALDKTFSGLHKEASNLPSKGDIEDQVIDVNTLQHDGSGQIYKTKFLRQSEEGGEVEVMFFRKLDEELNKVCNFYKDKVEALMHEADVLNKQMDAFIALRLKVENPDLNGSSLKRCYLSNVSSKMPPTSTTCSRDRNPGREYVGLTPEVDMNDDHQQEDSTAGPEVNSVSATSPDCDQREEVNKNDYKEDPIKILEHVKINNTLESPISTIKGVFKDSKEEDLSFNKEELRKVEERLRHVFVEFYHKLSLLKHYSFMNLAAFSKIMKKYEKITSRRAARLYMRIVDDSYLGNSDEVTGLLERVETTFIKNFSKSNRREGMKLLRPKAKREKHRVTFFSGFFLGCSIALLVAIVLRIEAHNLMDKEEGTQYMENIFPLYTLFAYIVLHMLMYAANIYFWRRYRVNYPFIFGFKRGTELGYREVFLLSTGLAVLASAGFLANLQLDTDSSTRDYMTITELVPLVLVIFVLLITFCPLNILYRSSRFFFIKCIFRCICAPLYPVTLPDFFLADQLTSQVQAFRSFELYICYYSLGEYSRRQSKCLSHGVYNTFYFIVAVIPYWLRFLQVLNIVLRFAWMQLVLEFRLHSLHKMTIITIFSCLEIIRRGIWSFFRLENEHLNNVGKYRAFKSVPLPFSYYETDNDDDDDDDDKID